MQSKQARGSDAKTRGMRSPPVPGVAPRSERRFTGRLTKTLMHVNVLVSALRVIVRSVTPCAIRSSLCASLGLRTRGSSPPRGGRHTRPYRHVPLVEQAGFFIKTGTQMRDLGRAGRHLLVKPVNTQHRFLRETDYAPRRSWPLGTASHPPRQPRCCGVAVLRCCRSIGLVTSLRGRGRSSGRETVPPRTCPPCGTVHMPTDRPAVARIVTQRFRMCERSSATCFIDLRPQPGQAWSR